MASAADAGSSLAVVGADSIGVAERRYLRMLYPTASGLVHVTDDNFIVMPYDMIQMRFENNSIGNRLVTCRHGWGDNIIVV